MANLSSAVVFLQNFKREEQNFVVQNEINNLSFLTGDNKSKMSKVDLLFTRSLSTLSIYFLILAAENPFSRV